MSDSGHQCDWNVQNGDVPVTSIFPPLYVFLWRDSRSVTSVWRSACPINIRGTNELRVQVYSFFCICAFPHLQLEGFKTGILKLGDFRIPSTLLEMTEDYKKLLVYGVYILIFTILEVKDEELWNMYSFLCVWKSSSPVRLFATPWTIQSMEFSRPEYWSG